MLILLTHAYPYGEGEIFLEQELPYLLEVFPSVSIIPLFSEGKPRRTPEAVKVITMPKERVLRKIGRSVIEPHTYLELKKRPETLFSISKIKYLLGYTSYCNRLFHFLRSEIQKTPEWENALFYTYWLHVQASALAKLKSEHFLNLKIVSRAHGYDVYETDYWPGYIPMRQFTLKKINRIFTVSEDGKNYLSQNHTIPSEKLTVSRIGTPDPGFKTSSSSQNCLSIVSCSHMVSEKRIERIIESIAYLAKSSNINLSWNHIGTGPLYDKLYKLADSHLSPHVKWKLHGKMSNTEIFEYYKNTPIDIFLSTSCTEGIPVSMMEAASCGIPIVATDVGGVREIVCEKNGILIPKETTSKQIAESILRSVNTSKKIASIEKWQTDFSMTKNYPLFAQALKNS